MMSSNLVDEAPVKHLHLKERSSIPSLLCGSFRSNVIDLDAQPGCWVGSAFDYVLFHVPRKELDDIAADLGAGPVSDIAEQAGFADQAAFTRTFHQIVGVSPGRWRRDYRRPA
jgi:AraC-like DNA-binding protein